MDEIKYPKTILITGAGGFLGKELVHQLLKTSEFQVIAVSSQKEKLNQLYGEYSTFSCYSANDTKALYFPWKDIYAVVHCAFSRSNVADDLAESLNSGFSFMKYAIGMGVHLIINISSQSVYGQKYIPPWTEQTPASPDTLYAMAKYASELLTTSLRSTQEGVITTNLRLSSLVGPGMEQRVIPKLLKNISNSQPLRIVGGQQQFSFLDGRDAASGIIALLKTDPKIWKPIYNLGTHEHYTLIELVRHVVEVAQTHQLPLVDVLIEEENISQVAGMNCNMFYSDTNWKPIYDLESIISHHVENM